MKKSTAILFRDACRKQGDELCNMLATYKDDFSKEEFEVLRLCVGRAMGEHWELLQFIYYHYPELEPEEEKPESRRNK